MGLLGRIVRPRAAVTWPAAVPWPLGQVFGLSDAGPAVTVERSLRLDAVTACIRALSEAVGALPLKTYQRTRGTQGRGRVDAWSEPVYRLLHDEPNPEMTAVDCWSLVMTHVNSWGNAYLGKNYTPDRAAPGGRRVSALWPLKPDTVQVSREGGVKTFTVTDPASGEQQKFTDRIIHIRGISLDGLVGLSPIALARHAIGRGLAEDEFSASFYRNAAIPRGVLQLDGELSPERADALRKRWEALYGGRNANRIAILEGGVEFKPITMPLEDAQFVETEKLTTQKVARIFRVPASMIGAESGDSLTYKTVEGDALHFERYSLRPWITRIEQALARDRDLFPGEGRGMYPEFLTDAILRADTKTRYESYAMALDPVTGWMDRSEVRALENLPPERDRSPMSVMEARAAALLGVSPRLAAELEDAEEARLAAHTNGGGHRG